MIDRADVRPERLGAERTERQDDLDKDSTEETVTSVRRQQQPEGGSPGNEKHYLRYNETSAETMIESPTPTGRWSEENRRPDTVLNHRGSSFWRRRAIAHRPSSGRFPSGLRSFTGRERRMSTIGPRLAGKDFYRRMRYEGSRRRGSITVPTRRDRSGSAG